MSDCRYCKGTGKILLLFSYVDCECHQEEETIQTVTNENSYNNCVVGDKKITEEVYDYIRHLQDLYNKTVKTFMEVTPD
jgi:hypothetical protein